MPSVFRALDPRSSAGADSARISPTAHYTGYVWVRNTLSPPALRTPQGVALFTALQPAMRVAARFNGGLTLEQMLLQRHRIIDRILDNAIATGRVAQVLEIAGGMSGRGLRFSRRYPELVYIEGDLPGMSRRKRSALQQARLDDLPGHHVVALDVLAERGPLALAEAIRARIDPARPLAIVTEGLVNYFPRDAVEGMWRRFAALLAPAGGLYVSDLHTRGETEYYVASRVFRRALELFARGSVHLHYEREDEARAALLSAGFTRARLSRPRDWRGTLELPRPRGEDVLRIIEAWRAPTG